MIISRISFALIAAALLLPACIPAPTQEALAVAGDWEGYFESQALFLTLKPAGASGALVDIERGTGAAIVIGEGRYLGQQATALGKVTPDSVLLVLHTSIGSIDLHLQPRDSTELRGTYGPGRAPITLRRSRAPRA